MPGDTCNNIHATSYSGCSDARALAEVRTRSSVASEQRARSTHRTPPVDGARPVVCRLVCPSSQQAQVGLERDCVSQLAVILQIKCQRWTMEQECAGFGGFTGPSMHVMHAMAALGPVAPTFVLGASSTSLPSPSTVRHSSQSLHSAKHSAARCLKRKSCSIRPSFFRSIRARLCCLLKK